MSEKVLVIDDDPAVLKSCEKVLLSEGYRVEVASDPVEGLERASRERFDVVLCDWKMPKLDGMDVVAELDRLCPESAVLMISGYPTVGRATEAMKRGAMDFLAKPFEPDELLAAVRRAQRGKVQREKQSLGRFEGLVRSWSFPVPSTDDKAPRTIAETVAAQVGVAKVTSPWLSVFVLGLLAGAYIGFGGLLSTSVTFDLAARLGVGLTKLVAGSAFSLGLMLVVIAGAELFTGNNLMVSSVITRRITLGAMATRWTLVFAANLLGSLVLVLLFYYSGLWRTADLALGHAALAIAHAKVSLGFGEALVRGIGCNWLVCLAVWMALASRATIGKVFAIFFPIMGFVAIGFEHCVANMYFIPVGMVLERLGDLAPPAGNAAPISLADFLLGNLLPVTIGNVIGGAVFVSLSYWGAYLREATTVPAGDPRS